MRKNIVRVLLFFVALAASAHAQTQSYLISQQGFFSMEPRYQYWSFVDAFSFSQAGSAMALYYPVGREFSVLVRGVPASTGGDLSGLSGYSDTQLGLTYHIENPDVVFTLGVNVPTGKTELTNAEFLTSIVLSNALFDLQTPSFGQGFCVNPGVIWAIPLSDDIVAGVGASYNYRGKYRPLQGSNDYDPGDELIFNGGLDLRLDETATVTGDLVFTHYANDQYDGRDIFAAGNKVNANVQFTKSIGQNELSLLVRFRTRAKNSASSGAGLVPDAEKIDPDRWELDAQYRFRLSDAVSLRLLAEAKYYQETPAPISGVNLGGLGVAPEFTVSRSLLLPITIHYQYGKLKDGRKLSGIEAAAGMKILF